MRPGAADLRPQFERLKQRPADRWRRLFDYRRMLTVPALKGIYRYHEFIGPVIPLEAVVYLGEGHTPVIEANAVLQEAVGMRFFSRTTARTPAPPSRTAAWPAP
jgi:threonine synthase